jgi:hypothetical protein
MSSVTKKILRSDTFSPSRWEMLHRKCACGESSGLTGKCEACQQKQFLGVPPQTKLRMNEPGDAYEQAADRAAEQVMRMPEPKPEVPAPASTSSTQQEVKHGLGVEGVPPIVHDVLSSSGRPLDAAARAFFEPRFGHDFGNVCAPDPEAAESRGPDAQAYTAGSTLSCPRRIWDGGFDRKNTGS